MKNEKTVLEWLEMLPEPYRSQAIENTKKDEPHSCHEPRDTLSDAIGAAFCWEDTVEGDLYWHKIQG